MFKKIQRTNRIFRVECHYTRDVSNDIFHNEQEMAYNTLVDSRIFFLK
jgi:hypothetical protein